MEVQQTAKMDANTRTPVTGLVPNQVRKKSQQREMFALHIDSACTNFAILALLRRDHKRLTTNILLATSVWLDPKSAESCNRELLLALHVTLFLLHTIYLAHCVCYV